MKIRYIMRQGIMELDNDLLSMEAAADLILSACMGLVEQPHQAQIEAHNICKAIEQGNTVEITHPTNGTCMIFQIPDIKKEIRH